MLILNLPRCLIICYENNNAFMNNSEISGGGSGNSHSGFRINSHASELALKNSEEEAKRIMEEEKQLQKILRESGNESNINKMEIEEEFDEEYGICPITLEYMEHPVLCPSGNYYEKWAIIDWIKKNNTDPLTREKLTIDMLVEDEEYRIKIIEYRRKYNK